MDETKPNSNQEEPAKAPKNGKKKEEKLLARLVKRKLEDYMNRTKREEHFDPAGVHRTTSRMHKYDLAYKVIEATTLEKRAKEKQKALIKNGTKDKLQPKLVRNSRQMTRSMEAVSITESVSKVLEEVPVRDLTSLHSQRGVLLKDGRKDVRYQGYTSHVGSVLNGKKYADYYIEQGLNTGNPSLSARLRDLKMRDRSRSPNSSYTYSSDSSYTTSSERTMTPSPRGQQTSQTSPPEEKDSSEEHFRRNQRQHEEHAVSDQKTEPSEEDGEPTDQTVQTSLDSLRDKPTQTSLTPTPDTSQESSSITQDSNDEQLIQTEKVIEKHSDTAPSEPDLAAEEDRSESLVEQEQNDRAEDEYSEDFEEEDIEVEEEVAEDLGEFENLPKRGKSSMSVETYMSIEHAEEVREEE